MKGNLLSKCDVCLLFTKTGVYFPRNPAGFGDVDMFVSWLEA